MPHRSFRWGVGRCVLNEEKAYLFLQNPLKVDRVNSYELAQSSQEPFECHTKF